jgi:acetate kinase
LVITCLLLLCLFAYYKWTSGPSKSALKRTVVNDPDAQAIYDNKKHGDEDKKLSLKEKIELSWQFLYEITETVLNKFTQNDRDEIKELGQKLAENGAKYQHVVNAASVKQALSKEMGVGVEQDHKTPQGRGI